MEFLLKYVEKSPELKDEKEKYNYLYNLVEKIMGNGSHGFDHVLRVQRMALHLAKIENADKKIVKYASLLHDIARPYQDITNGKVEHAQKGAEYANFLLKELGFEENFVKDVAHAIEAHRFRVDKEPKTIEAKILHDADKLDSIGAIGIMRAAFFTAEHKGLLHELNPKISKDRLSRSAYEEFLVKLRKVKDKIFLESAKKIALHRHKFMEQFFEELNKEWLGEI